VRGGREVAWGAAAQHIHADARCARALRADGGQHVLPQQRTLARPHAVGIRRAPVEHGHGATVSTHPPPARAVAVAVAFQGTCPVRIRWGVESSHEAHVHSPLAWVPNASSRENPVLPLESRAKAARLDLDVSEGWVSLLSRGLCGGADPLLPTP
jgi:hypothetical protein